MYSTAHSIKQSLIVFGLSMLVCLCFLKWAPTNLLEKPCGDCEDGYIAVAKNFTNGFGWVDNNHDFSIIRPPGHSLILAGLIKISQKLVFPEQTIYRIFNSLMLSLSAVLILLISRLVWGEQRLHFAPYLWITCPFTLWFINQPYSEVPLFVLLFLP